MAIASQCELQRDTVSWDSDELLPLTPVRPHTPAVDLKKKEMLYYEGSEQQKALIRLLGSAFVLRIYIYNKKRYNTLKHVIMCGVFDSISGRGGSVVERRTSEREFQGLNPTTAV